MRLRKSNKSLLQWSLNHSQKGIVLIVMLVILIMGSSYLFVSNLNAKNNINMQNKTVVLHLNTIRDALLGYAVANGRLPCPDTNADGLQNGPNCNAVEGGVPWTDLGIIRLDIWGHDIRYRADDNYTSVAPTTANSSSGLRIETLVGGLLSLGNPTAPAVILFSCGADGVPNDENDADGSANTSSNCTNPGAANNVYIKDSRQSNFDDILVSIPQSLLYSRMVAANQWPP